MKRSSAAEGHERELAWIITSLHGDEPDGSLHGRFSQEDDAVCKFFHRGDRPSGFFHVAAGAIKVQFDLAAKEVFRMQAAQNKVGITDRRFCAMAVTDWSRISAGRFRSHMQNSCLVKMRQRPASGPDGVNIKHGDADGHLR